MFFIFLVFLAAIILEALGCYISVIGLAANTSLIIVLLVISLDFSKVIIASVLYKQWKNLHWFLKGWLVPSLIFLIVVTSSGTFGFIKREFSKSTVGQEQQVAVLDLLKAEQAKLEKRKLEIDNQVSQLPPANVLQRRKLTELFSAEITRINDRLVELDKEIPAATVGNMQGATQSGTLVNIAESFNITNEEAAKLIAGLIVLVVDPLAIVLLTVANFLILQRKKELLEEDNKQKITNSEKVIKQPIPESAVNTAAPPVILSEQIVEKSPPIVAEKKEKEDIITTKEVEPVISPEIATSLPSSFTDNVEEVLEADIPVVESKKPVVVNEEIDPELLADMFPPVSVEEETVGIENVADIIAELAEEELENSKPKYSLLENEIYKSTKPSSTTEKEEHVSNEQKISNILYTGNPDAISNVEDLEEDLDSSYNWEEDMDDILVGNEKTA